MCKRSDDDPLVRVLTDRYKLNILRQPRRGVGVGELLIREGMDIRCAGSITKLFDPELDLAQNEPVALPDVDGVASARRSAAIAAAPLLGLLTAIGAPGVSSASAALRRERDMTVAYSLAGARYRSTDLVTLGDELSSRILRHGNALYAPGNEYFVAHAAAEARVIKLAFSAGSGKAVRLAAELAAVVNAETSADSVYNQSGHLTITAAEPVTFGLAVVQLTTDGGSIRLQASPPLRAVRTQAHTKGQSVEETPDFFFTDPAGDVLVDVG